METIRALGATLFEDVYAAWQAAFAGYEKTWTQEELRADLIRRGYNAGLSFGAFEGEQLVGFVLNGIGNYSGLPTAYDTGTGTIPQARGRGLTKKVFDTTLPILKNAGIVQYVLEVLQRNEPAINIYRSLGFRISRELAYFIADGDSLRIQEWQRPRDIRILPLPAMILDAPREMWDFEPTWQNAFESIARQPDAFVVVGAFAEEKMIGYGIIEPLSGDIPQIAVAPAHRRNGIGSAILKALIQQNKRPTIKLINVETSCNSLMCFLARQGMKESGRQYEMIRELGSTT
jgi:ribosomal protein S18 acetylase RimI-like enzyme